jgi:hypothetical protein
VVRASTLDGYRQAARALAPSAVSQYLATQQWELEARHGDVREIWRLPGLYGRPQARIMLPLATDYVDFHQRFSDTLRSLGHLHGWDAEELQERIESIRADLFVVRLDQAMTDATISIRQAEQTVAAIYRMLQAAATTTADPDHSHRGRRPARVTEFLEEDVRLGHTKRGSFVFTVVTRLGSPPGSPGSPGPTSLPLPRTDAAGPAPFQRRVMETLARGLESTRALAAEEDPRPLESPAEFGLSATLVEALEDVSQTDGLWAVDLSFQWAAAAEPPAVGRKPIVLDRAIMSALPRVRERLIRREKPLHRETLIGLVKSLTREDSDADGETGSIVLIAEAAGRTRNVQVPLTPEDHEWAIVAYRNKWPFTVTGDLVFARRAWRLTGEIEVDARFLEQRLADERHHHV